MNGQGYVSLKYQISENLSNRRREQLKGEITQMETISKIKVSSICVKASL